MPRTLDEVKAGVSGKYLGRAGIHGVGVRRAQGALAVYLRPGDVTEQERVLRAIEAEAAPYPVIVVSEEGPVAH
ncbi:MAG TPA: hypothetical protein VHG08_17995 [Longimicrobium sp.]|nr:hypothetical protein [Longimicrobium sp.]